MSKFHEILTSAALAAALAAPAFADPAQAGPLGLGRPALPEEIAAWDLDVSPNGDGLPEGSGDVATGEELFSDNCASCHGDPLKTVGSYWPHLSTAFDYVRRSMPFGGAQVLTDDEVYAIVAYILYNNDLVEDDFVLSKENFLEVTLPNAEGFFVDDRDAAELPLFVREPCMENCKATVEITAHASVVDVTPDE